jgi:hypothetical protein
VSQTQRPQHQRRQAAPRFLLEDAATGLYAVATDKGLQLAKRPDATEYLTRADALIAAGTQPVEVVRVDA